MPQGSQQRVRRENNGAQQYSSKAIHRAGDELSFAPGVYEIAALAAGGAIALTDAVMAGTVRNGYGLVRPPGHHAERNEGMGFCVFNNVAVVS